jgi:hypothetical protein
LLFPRLTPLLSPKRIPVDALQRGEGLRGSQDLLLYNYLFCDQFLDQISHCQIEFTSNLKQSDPQNERVGMITSRLKHSILVTLLAIITSSTLNAQLLHYRFSGAIEAPGAAELVPGLTFKHGEAIEGYLTIDPSHGYPLTSPDLPPRNKIYPGAVSQLSLSIGSETLFSPNDLFLDLSVYDHTPKPNRASYETQDEGSADTLLITSPQPIPVSSDSSSGASATDLALALVLSDSSSSAFPTPRFPVDFRLDSFDTAYGVIKPWYEPNHTEPREIRFRIDSFDLEAMSVRPVIVTGPATQTVQAGKSLELSFQPYPGSRYLRSQWSRNGVSYNSSPATNLPLDNLQPQDSGTYRVTAWNTAGERTTAIARVQVESKQHRVHPLALSGWNTDLIVASGESSTTHPPFDGINGKWYATGYRHAVDGFPTSGDFTSASNPEVRYQLQPYESKNALWLKDYQEATGTLTLHQPTQFESLSVASATSSHTEAATLRFVFADDSVSEWYSMPPQDWATQPGRSNHAAIAGLGRLEFDGFSHGLRHDESYGFGLYETEIDLVELGLADQTIAALEFKKPDLVNSMAIFAVSGQEARLESQPHLAWSSDSSLRIFEVASSREGPWRSVDLDQGVVGEQRLAVVPQKMFPRYYRGLSADLERQTLALYSFNHNGADRLGNSPALQTANSRYRSGALLLSSLNERLSPERPRHFLEVKDMHYNNFSLAYVFRLADGNLGPSTTLLGGGRGYQWLRLKLAEDRLVVILGDEEFRHVSDLIRIEPGQWHRIMVGVHTRDRELRIQWNGQIEERVVLPEGFHYQVRPANATDADRAFTFFDTSDSTPFLGNVDLLMATRQMLTPEESQTVDGWLSANPVGNDVQRGHHLLWEENLDRFRLQSAPSGLGPWQDENAPAAIWNGRKILPLQGNSPLVIYRLIAQQ